MQRNQGGDSLIRLSLSYWNGAESGNPSSRTSQGDTQTLRHLLQAILHRLIVKTPPEFTLPTHRRQGAAE
jgi:hypothetical protein